MGINQETLKSIKANYQDDESCFTQMISVWLQITHHPLWEELLAALEQVGCSEVAQDVKLNLGEQPDTFQAEEAGTGQYT